MNAITKNGNREVETKAYTGQRWEYFTASLSTDGLDVLVYKVPGGFGKQTTTFDELGQQGWECCGVSQTRAVFKRAVLTAGGGKVEVK